MHKIFWMQANDTGKAQVQFDPAPGGLRPFLAAATHELLEREANRRRAVLPRVAAPRGGQAHSGVFFRERFWGERDRFIAPFLRPKMCPAGVTHALLVQRVKSSYKTRL
jgi:hypothetical protein